MNDRADLAHGLVNGRQGEVEGVNDFADLKLFFTDFLLGSVQLHSRSKELLNCEIVKIPTDTVALIQKRGDVFRVTR